MSDFSQGPGWWIASDGKWYPPHLHPSFQPTPYWTPGWPPSGPTQMPIPAHSGSKHRTAWAVGSIVGIVVVLVAVGIGIGLNIGSAPGHGGVLTADEGTVVFSDNFHNPYSGWQSAPDSGATFTYENNTYVIVPTGNLHWFSFAPYQEPVQQMSAAVTATESASSPVGAGFGVMCLRGTGSSQVRFEFVALNDGQWFIEENTGVPSPNRVPKVLKQDVSPAALSTATTVEGVCESQADDRTTSLDMFVNGTDVADVNAVTPLPGTGWLSAIVADSRKTAPSRITATDFVERSLSQ